MSDPVAQPLYVQISDLLIREIMAGRLVAGERLPPERELADQHGISVGTLRKALEALTERGLLERRQGSGNYVKPVREPSGVYAFFRLELVEGGGFPTAEVLSVERVAKPVDMPEFGTTEEAHRIRRLRRIDGRPAALEEIWLDGGYVARIAPGDLGPSLYLYYKERLGLWIARAEDRVGLGTVPGWTVPEFGPAAGVPIPLIERISWAQDGARAEASRTWFDPEIVRYVARIA